jgi:hypothetical protein
MMESLEQIEAALARLPEPVTIEEFDHRTRLVTKQMEMVNAARLAAAPRQQPVGVLFNAPDGVGHVMTRLGRFINVELIDGRRMIRLHPGEFRDLVMGSNGRIWEIANPDGISEFSRSNWSA